ncbi:MAG: IS66 family transposase [Pseudomonadota bacterium]
MTRDEADAILELPRAQAIDVILALAQKAEKFDQLRGDISPTCPSGMTPPYLKEPGKRRRKKPGQKKGHPGVARKRPEKVDHYRNHTLKYCPDCRMRLGKPIKSHKRYTVDIPPVAPEVTEHTVHGYWCPNCKKRVYPKVTDALPNSTLALTVLVMTAWLHYWVGMSVRNIVKLLATFWAFDVSPGGLTQAWRNLAATVRPIYDEIGEKIQNTAVLNADETGWRISGITHWLWCFASDSWCYFVIDKSRGSPVIKRVLGKLFEGVLICDFWGAYNKISTLATQRCFYHLLTELEKVDKSNKSDAWKSFRKKLGRLLMDAVRISTKKTDLSPAIFNRRKRRLYIRLDQLIDSPREDKDVNRLIKRLIRHRNEFFTFLEYKGVSPYNNHAEQQIRKPVVTRKISQQNRSDQGAEAHAIFMSLFRSAELQGLNPVEKILADAKILLGATQKEKFTFKLAA